MWNILMALALVGASAAGQEAVTFTDDFSAHAEGSDGSPKWQPLTREWVIHNGAYEHTAPQRRGTLTWLKQPIFSDVDFSVRFKILEEGRGVRAPGMVIRSQDSKTYYYVHFDSGNSQVILVRSDRKKPWQELQRIRRTPIARETWHMGRITARGSHLAVYLDDKLICEADDSALTAGRIGLRAGQGHIIFDDVHATGTPGVLAKEWEMVPGTKPVDDFECPKLEDAEHLVAERGGGYFPVLIRLQDGSLGAVVRGGAPHIGIKGRLDWIHSEDGGKTWSEPSVIVDSKWDDRNPALGQMKDGTIVCAYAEAQTYNAEGKWDRSAGEYVQFFVTSQDNGRTWSEKQELYTGPIRGGSPFGRIIVLSDGTALLPMYGGARDDWHGEPKLPEGSDQLSGFVRSTDNGKTWGDFGLVSHTGHNELSLLALTDDHLLAAVRTVGGAVNLFESRDAGRTWEGPRPVTQPSQHPADLCRLSGKRLLLVYGNRREPFGVGGVISDDEGRTWDYARRFQVGWTSLQGDCGYPSVVRLDDGTLVIMYYSVGTSDLGGDQFALVVRAGEQAILKASGR